MIIRTKSGKYHQYYSHLAGTAEDVYAMFSGLVYGLLFDLILDTQIAYAARALCSLHIKALSLGLIAGKRSIADRNDKAVNRSSFTLYSMLCNQTQ